MVSGLMSLTVPRNSFILGQMQSAFPLSKSWRAAAIPPIWCRGMQSSIFPLVSCRGSTDDARRFPCVRITALLLPPVPEENRMHASASSPVYGSSGVLPGVPWIPAYSESSSRACTGTGKERTRSLFSASARTTAPSVSRTCCSSIASSRSLFSKTAVLPEPMTAQSPIR
ncbi:unknown [Clostridium sp. CAG:149]|nr:unknown [Clostridium sp. CAG:149]